MAKYGKAFLLCTCLIIYPFISKVHSYNEGKQTEKTLRTAYKNYFPIGCAVTPEKDLTDPVKSEFIKKQFSSLTARQAMQPFWVQPKEGTFRWDEADQLVDFAVKNDMKVRGHCLIYYRHMPGWFFKDGDKLASRELLLKRMKDHITAEVSRYKGKVYCWDVVNEAITNQSQGFYRSDDMFYQIIGEDYIAKAFEFAHAADPNAKLFYNNDCLTQPYRRDKIRTLLKGLLDKGVPVHGMGIQGHLGINSIPEKALQDNIDAFSSLGIEVQFTEVDVSIYKKGLTRDELATLAEDYTPQIEDIQADVYRKIFAVCRKNKDKVTGITTWGFADPANAKTVASRTKLVKKNYPLLFDENLKPKKAFVKAVNF